MRRKQAGVAIQAARKDTNFFLGGKTRNTVLCVILAAATIALYSPVIEHPFVVIDDSDYVTENLHVQGGLSWSTIKWAFTATTAANWHPLTWLSHALDYQFFALNPAGHHIDSLLIHVLNVVMLFLLLQWLTQRVGPSLLVATLFAWHPLNVESVAWVAERKNVLSTVFFLGSIGAYGWYAKKPHWRRYLTVAVLFALGLMAKPMVITLPFVLLLLDYWPLGRTPASPASAPGAPQMAVSTLLLEKIPLLLLSAASAVITLKAQQSGYSVRTLYQFSLAARLQNAVVAFGLYLWKMLWPARLAALYPHPADLPVWQWVLSAMVLIAVTAFTVVFRRYRHLLVGWLWFLGILVPVIGLVQVGDASMADRYAYLPLIGVFVIVAWGLSDLASAMKISSTWLVIAAVCVLISLGAVAYRQISYWDSEYDLWSHTVAVTKTNPFAHDWLGAALVKPDVAMSRQNLEDYDTEEKRTKEARRQFEQALALRRELAQKNPSAYLPDMAVTLVNLGNLARTENNVEEARQDYEEALQIHTRLTQQKHDPYPADRAAALINLGYLERSKLENDKAGLHFESALETYRQLAQQDAEQYLPNVAEALNSLAVTNRDEKRMDEARRYYEEALPIRRQLAEQNRSYVPYLAMTLNDLGILYGTENRSEDARRYYEEALKLYDQLAEREPGTYTPYLAGTLSNLAFLHGSQNQLEESRMYYNKALVFYRELSHNDPNKYALDVRRVEASLEELDKKASSK
jgi:protein O-mannosyl-transferase